MFLFLRSDELLFTHYCDKHFVCESGICEYEIISVFSTSDELEGNVNSN